MKAADKKKKTKKKKSGLGIRTRFVIYFTSFVLLILGVIWLFQIYLLNYFYERTQMKMLDRAGDTMAQCTGDESLKQTAYNIAVGNSVCVRIFRVSDHGLREEYHSIEALPNCLIHNLSAETLDRYYRKAVNNGGELVERVEFSASIPENRRTPPGGETAVETAPPVMAIAVNVIAAEDGAEYAIFLNAAFSPMNSTVHTLNSQFGWLAVSLLLIAVLASLLFAMEIARPLIRMTAAAKRLAGGRYKADFRPEGYKETRELADALNCAAEELSRNEKLRRELIANVSHDLRTPLTMISGYAEIMRDIPGENGPENVQVIIDESKRLTELVNDMFDLSKIQSGAKVPEMTELDLTATVRDVMQRYSLLISHEGYDVVFSADIEGVRVMADRTMMLQVIYNLINNAINYTGPDKAVRVTQKVTDGNVRVTVSDTGEGIAPENIPYIWDRYYKVDKLHRRAAVGTGLGLSIVKNVLQLHGASFGVESTPGEGSSFWFELPVLKNGESC